MSVGTDTRGGDSYDDSMDDMAQPSLGEVLFRLGRLEHSIDAMKGEMVSRDVWEVQRDQLRDDVKALEDNQRQRRVDLKSLALGVLVAVIPSVTAVIVAYVH